MPLIERKTYPLYSPSAWFRRNLYRRSRSSRTFAGLAGMLFVVRVIRRASSKQPEVVSLDRLAPGQTIFISTTAPPTKRERRAARRRGAESTV